MFVSSISPSSSSANDFTLFAYRIIPLMNPSTASTTPFSPVRMIETLNPFVASCSSVLVYAFCNSSAYFRFGRLCYHPVEFTYENQKRMTYNMEITHINQKKITSLFVEVLLLLLESIDQNDSRIR